VGAWGSGRRKAVGIAVVLALGVLALVLKLELPLIKGERSISGAVLVASADPRKQLPVPDAEISARAGGRMAYARSDASGFFRLNWRAGVWPGETLTIEFRRPGYQPLEITQRVGNQLYIARMTPAPSVRPESQAAEISVADVRVRYSVKATTTVEIGSTAKTFEVFNTANVPCKGPPCSPDGKWQAATGSISLNAGDGHAFQDVRVSCIAGPCPFTKVETAELDRGGPRIDVSVRAWSDTVTFLVEAEVVHTMIGDAIREAYPSIFGSELTFTLPPTGEGPSIEAELDGLAIVFPLGPDLRLSWAVCTVQAPSNATRLYSCKLKPGYRFR